MNKPRRFDLSPDNFIAGIAGQLSASELGVYWVMCLLFYSRGGPFKYDETRICSLLKGTHWRTVRAASERLHELGKITSEQGHVTVKGCSGPLQDAVRRISRAIENGGKGGRPPKENNDLDKPGGFQDEKLARDAPSPPPSPSQPPTKDRKKKPPQAALELAFVLPPWVPEKTWIAYLDFRKSRRAPNTAHAKDLVIRDLSVRRDLGEDPGELLEQCIKRGWIGIFPLKSDGPNGHGKISNNDTWLAGAADLAAELRSNRG